MSEDQLGVKAREAIRHIRNWLMHNGQFPTVRDLMKSMDYKSPRSPMLLLNELEQKGFIERKPQGGYKLVRDLESETMIRTVSVPLVGVVTCGIPILAQENIEAYLPVSKSLAKGDSKYFLLRAKGDSMNLAGINDGDLILVKQQNMADNGQRIVAMIDDEATVKEFHRSGTIVTLKPISSNTSHQPIIVSSDFQIQGVVVASIPRFDN